MFTLWPQQHALLKRLLHLKERKGEEKKVKDSRQPKGQRNESHQSRGVSQDASFGATIGGTKIDHAQVTQQDRNPGKEEEEENYCQKREQKKSQKS